jgi:hypothetical protein
MAHFVYDVRRYIACGELERAIELLSAIQDAGSFASLSAKQINEECSSAVVALNHALEAIATYQY